MEEKRVITLPSTWKVGDRVRLRENDYAIPEDYRGRSGTVIETLYTEEESSFPWLRYRVPRVVIQLDDDPNLPNLYHDFQAIRLPASKEGRKEE